MVSSVENGRTAITEDKINAFYCPITGISACHGTHFITVARIEKNGCVSKFYGKLLKIWVQLTCCFNLRARVQLTCCFNLSQSDQKHIFILQCGHLASLQ